MDHSLGLEIIQNSDGSIPLSQKCCIEKCLARSDMAPCKPVTTPSYEKNNSKPPDGAGGQATTLLNQDFSN